MRLLVAAVLRLISQRLHKTADRLDPPPFGWHWETDDNGSHTGAIILWAAGGGGGGGGGGTVVGGGGAGGASYHDGSGHYPETCALCNYGRT